MRGWQWTVVAVLVAVIVGLGGVVGYRVWDDHRDQRDYPSSVRDAFLLSCAEGGHSSDGQCRCALDYLEDHYALTEYTRIAREAAAGKVPGEALAAREACGITAPLTTTTLAFDEAEVDPYPGAWTTTSAIACPYEYLDKYHVVHDGRAHSVKVPLESVVFRFSSFCPFDPPEPDY